jgi:hypothetical protein
MRDKIIARLVEKENFSYNIPSLVDGAPLQRCQAVGITTASETCGCKEDIW